MKKVAIAVGGLMLFATLLTLFPDKKVEPTPKVEPEVVKKDSVYLTDEEKELFKGIEFLSEEDQPPYKRSFVVRLPRKTNERALTVLGKIIHYQLGSTYEKVFINYYLPGMDTEGVCWAYTHFTPELEIQINNWAVTDQVTQLETDPLLGK